MNMGIRGRAAALLVTVAMAAVFAGCGGGSSSSADSASEPSKEFLGKGENGTVASVGKEAGAAEREAASQVVEESLQARADGDWATQCATLAAPLVTQLESTGKLLGAKGGCAGALEVQAEQASGSVRASTMTGPIDALRVAGKKGFALYHGIQSKDYVIRLVTEDGEWKVLELQEQPIG